MKKDGKRIKKVMAYCGSSIYEIVSKKKKNNKDKNAANKNKD